MRHNKDTNQGRSPESLIHFSEYQHPITNEEHLDVLLRFGKKASVHVGTAVQKYDPEGMPWISNSDGLADRYEFHPQNFVDVKAQILKCERLLIEREIQYRRQVGKGSVPRMLTARLKELENAQPSIPEKETELQQIRNKKSKEQSRTR